MRDYSMVCLEEIKCKNERQSTDDCNAMYYNYEDRKTRRFWQPKHLYNSFRYFVCFKLIVNSNCYWICFESKLYIFLELWSSNKTSIKSPRVYMTKSVWLETIMFKETNNNPHSFCVTKTNIWFFGFMWNWFW